jgi:hypothetical protein
VRRALRAHMGPDDLEQVGLFVRSLFPFEEIAAMQHGHITLSQVRPHIGQETFASYFKFAFVRNPFDRFVSYCAFMTRESKDFQHNPHRVMREVLLAPPTDHILFAPQHNFVTDATGGLLTNAIGRVENMQADYDAFANRLGFPTTQLERANSSQRGDYRIYYDRALINAVSELYSRDLELFGYEF